VIGVLYRKGPLITVSPDGKILYYNYFTQVYDDEKKQWGKRKFSHTPDPEVKANTKDYE
jgi:hypothetical protein